MGMKKTVAKFNERAWWPGMKNEVCQWIKECEACQLTKLGPGQGKLPLISTVVGDFNERIAVDLIGPFPESRGFKYVLTVQDCFTKWSEAYPLTKKKTALVVDALNTQWISRFGMPKTILSDNGMEFAGKIYKGMMKQLGIQILNSSPYYPRANGMVERLNATLQDMLKTAIIETGNGWVDLLPYITATYRTTVHETTGYTPNKLVLGKEIPLPIDAIMRAEQHEGRCPTEYVNWVENTLYAVKQIAAATIRKQQERQKKHHDKTLKNRDVQEQDVVLRWRPSRKKLQSKWIGPYKVIRRHETISTGRRGREV
jgi:transposase InsO family protein